MNHAYGSDVIEVRRNGRIDALVALRKDDQHSIALLDVVDEFDGAFTAYGKWDDGIRKNDGITDRKDRQFFRDGLNLLLDIIKLFEVTFHASASPKPTMLLSARVRR